jgi:hypothetical protein
MAGEGVRVRWRYLAEGYSQRTPPGVVAQFAGGAVLP